MPVVLLCLFYQSVFPELLKFTAYMFSETVMSECPSRAVMCKNGFIKGLSVETVLSDGNYQIFIVNSNNVNEFGNCVKNKI
jgi:hypothetical protein